MTTQLPRAVCAWCLKVMREGPIPTSHTICPACSAEMIADIEARDNLTAEPREPALGEGRT